MRILVDINHPAHVHLFKYAIQTWQSRGDEVRITARDKDLTFELLESLGLDYVPIPATKPGFLGYLVAVLQSDWTVWQLARDFDPDMLIGTSFAAAHVSKLVRGKSLVFGEDDWASARDFWRLVVPFADFIITPDTIPDSLGHKHIKYAGCQELAYLHPQRFEPDRKIVSGLLPGEGSYSIVRFVSLTAFHDKNERGISLDDAKQVVDLLAGYGRVFISSEGALPQDLQKFALDVPADKIHHVLAGAKVLVSDSQSMTIEAALLGVPSLRINSFVGRIPVIEEMQRDYSLTEGFLPEQISEVRKRLAEILIEPNIGQIWQSRRDRYLADKTELSTWIVNFIDSLNQVSN